MKTRYSVNDAGELVDRDGVSLGRLTSLTLELDPSASRDYRVGVEVENSNVKDVKKTPHPFSKEVSIVWQHYVETFGAGRQELNHQRRRVIEQALKGGHTVEECCRAITGLSKSPWHNGQNDNGARYLDVRYALKGNGARSESTDERIAKMVELASLPSPAPVTKDHGVKQGYVDALHDVVRRAWRKDPSMPQASIEDKARAAEAIEELKEYGETVSFDADDNDRPVFS